MVLNERERSVLLYQCCVLLLISWICRSRSRHKEVLEKVSDVLKLCTVVMCYVTLWVNWK